VGLTSGPTYTYDDEDRLTSVTNPGSTQTTFAYDGLSRLRKSDAYTWSGTAWTLSNETRRIYDGMDIIQERNSSNAVTANLTRAGNIGGILARTTSAGSVYYHSDGDGNVVQLTNSTGSVVGSYTYNAFGSYTSTGTAATANPYTFSSKEQFGGLYNFGYRYYMAGSGRWLNRDPIREDGGLNLYGYVGNDPEDGVDQFGLVAAFSIPGWFKPDLYSLQHSGRPTVPTPKAASGQRVVPGKTPCPPALIPGLGSTRIPDDEDPRVIAGAARHEIWRVKGPKVSRKGDFDQVDEEGLPNLEGAVTSITAAQSKNPIKVNSINKTLQKALRAGKETDPKSLRNPGTSEEKPGEPGSEVPEDPTGSVGPSDPEGGGSDIVNLGPAVGELFPE